MHMHSWILKDKETRAMVTLPTRKTLFSIFLDMSLEDFNFLPEREPSIFFQVGNNPIQRVL